MSGKMVKQNFFTIIPIYGYKVKTLLNGKLIAKTLDIPCDLTIPVFSCIIFTLTKMVNKMTIKKYKVAKKSVKGLPLETLDNAIHLTTHLFGFIILA
jgi:hypothetical protein